MSVPDLRFPEFEGEWEEKKLGDVVNLMQSGLSRKLEGKDIGLPVIRSNNLINNKLVLSDIRYWHSNDDKGANLKNYFLKEMDLLVNFINSLNQIGKTAIYKGELKRNSIFTTNIMRLNFNSDTSTLFIHNYFQTKMYLNYIQSITKPAVNQASFTTVEFKKFKMNIPSLPEQEKIASFLSTVDEKIEKLEKKLELWEAYKKGMMQKIFSQELRFKDENGEDYPDWEEKRLKDFVTIPKKEKLSNVDNETLLTVKLHCKGIEANYGIQPKITKRGRPYFKRNAGEFLIGRQNFHNGGMGIVPAEIDGFISSNAITSLKINEEKVLKRYLLYYFSRRDYYKKAEVIMGGTGQKELSEKNLLNLDVKTPILNEQLKIAEFLLNIENIIVLVNHKLEIMIDFKKGLLKRCFC